MKRILLFLILSVSLFSSCEFHQVKGNGDISSENRQVNRAERIHIDGSFDVEITQGDKASVKVEADENLLDYIQVEEDEGKLYIRMRDGLSFSTNNKITVYITTPLLSELSFSGSGKLIGKNKLTGSTRLALSLAGSGEVDIDVNAPEIDADISGSGSITIKGETKKQRINLGGSGDYRGYDLKSEDARVSIAGSGNVRLFADAELDVSIAGSGSVYYKGSPNIIKNIVGSGDIKQKED